MPPLLEHPPDRVEIYEVGPRNGLQNESATVGTARKVRLIEALVEAGLNRVEITSFVSPRLVPQLADADELVRLLKPAPQVRYAALCPNSRGLERAAEAGVQDIAVFLSASETHNRRNLHCSVAESLDGYREVVAAALSRQLGVRGYIDTAWGCPYEGETDGRRVLTLAQRLLEMGCDEICLADAAGLNTPMKTRRLLGLMVEDLPVEKLALHLYDTRGQALASVLVGLELGIRTFDASIAGLGDCADAPGAPGNLATEDLVYMLEGIGIQTGVDAQKLFEAGRVAAAIVNRELPGHVHKAGLQALKG